MQAFAFLNVFVPIGNEVSCEDISKSIGHEIVSEIAQGTILVRLFEYRDIEAVKKVCSKCDHVIITNPDVFCCGHYYTDVDEYKKLVNRTFPNDHYRVIDINKIYPGESLQELTKRVAKINWSNIHNEAEILNDRIPVFLGWFHNHSMSIAQVPATAATEKCTLTCSIVHPSAAIAPTPDVSTPEIATTVSPTPADNPAPQVIPTVNASAIDASGWYTVQLPVSANKDPSVLVHVRNALTGQIVPVKGPQCLFIPTDAKLKCAHCGLHH